MTPEICDKMLHCIKVVAVNCNIHFNVKNILIIYT